MLLAHVDLNHFMIFKSTNVNNAENKLELSFYVSIFNLKCKRTRTAGFETGKSLLSQVAFIANSDSTLQIWKSFKECLISLEWQYSKGLHLSIYAKAVNFSE